MKKRVVFFVVGILMSVSISQAYQVRFCGDNANGQQGFGDVTTRYVPMPNYLMLDVVKAVACGSSHTLMLTLEGEVYACGDNSYGQLGVGAATSHTRTPYKITGLENIKAIAAGNHHSLFLTYKGEVYVCGRNDSGQLGLGDTVNRYLPVESYFGRAVAIDCGGAFSAVRLADGNVWVTGDNAYGQLGQGNTNNRMSWVEVTTDFSHIVGVSCGGYHMMLWASGGAISSCGRNNIGQLGTGDNIQRNSPEPITNGYSGAVQVECGKWHTIVLEADGGICGCGFNAYGQLGLDDAIARNTFTAVPGMVGKCVDICAGGDQSFVRLGNGGVKGSGRNTKYELGLGDNTNRFSFTKIPGAWSCVDFDTATYNSSFVTTPSTAVNDFDGDGCTDIGVYWPETGQWFIQQSGNGQIFSGGALSWGWSAAAPVTGDFDGNGFSDVAVYHRQGGTFYIDYSLGGSDSEYFSGMRYAVAGDYDGDGATDIGVYAFSTGGWVIQLSSGGTYSLNWGWGAVRPIGLQY